MAYGHVKMSRKAYAEDPLWNQPRVFSRWEAWEDMIQLAAFRRYRRPVADGYVELERGEILASLRFLANRWKWGVKKVRGFTQWCLNEGRITTQRETQHGTVYLLANYDSYQSNPSDEDTPKDTSRAHRGHTEGTPRAQVKKAVKQLSSKAVGCICHPQFDEFKKGYPQRDGGQGWKRAGELFTQLVESGEVEAETLITTAIAYGEAMKRSEWYGTSKVKQAQTFLGPGNWWQEDYSEPERPLSVDEKTDLLRKAAMNA